MSALVVSPRKPGPEIVGCGDDEMTELAGGLDPDRTRANASRPATPVSASTVPVPPLAWPRGTTRQRCPRRFDRVELVGLAVATTFLAVRAIDLDHRHTRRCEVAGQPRTVGAGALHADPLERTERAEPTRQRRDIRPASSGTTALPTRRRCTSSAAATCTSRCVSTPPTTERELSTMVICHPFSLVELGKGWHARPGRRS